MVKKDFIKERDLKGMDAEAEGLREKHSNYIDNDKPVCHYYWRANLGGRGSLNFYKDAPKAFIDDIVKLDKKHHS